MGYGVIGSPTGSGPVSLGSSPGTPATPMTSADAVDGIRACVSRVRGRRAERPLGSSGPAVYRSDAAAAPFHAGHAQQHQQDDGPDDRPDDAGGVEVVNRELVVQHQVRDKPAQERAD